MGIKFYTTPESGLTITKMVIRQETVIYKETVWQINRIRHDNGTWTGTATLISEPLEESTGNRHFHSSALVNSNVQERPLSWIHEMVDKYKE